MTDWANVAKSFFDMAERAFKERDQLKADKEQSAADFTSLSRTAKAMAAEIERLTADKEQLAADFTTLSYTATAKATEVERLQTENEQLKVQLIKIMGAAHLQRTPLGQKP
jgi:chromosome segregation ATPase